MKIKKEMKVREVIKKHPETVKVFMKYGLGCVGCPMSEPESLEEAAVVHGIDGDEFLRELNSLVKNNEAE